MKTYGYCRVSTAKQNIERQERNIRAACPDAIIIKEVYTGTCFQGRKELEKILARVQAGDCINQSCIPKRAAYQHRYL